MGWTYTNKPENVKRFLNSNHTWINHNTDGSGYRSYTVLKSAIVNFREYYAAVAERDAHGKTLRVFAGVCMINYVRDPNEHYNFGYKDMGESVGPCITNCPKAILKLLTPIDPATNKYAQEWRDSCWANISKRKTVKSGNTLTFANPIKFTDGTQHTVFTVVKHPYKQRKVMYKAQNGGYYKLPRRLIADAQVA